MAWPGSTDDLALLHIQAERSLDARGRIAGYDGVRLACSAAGQALWIGADVPEPIAAALIDVVARAPAAASPDQPPPALDRCAALLAPAGSALVRASGPSYLIPDHPAIGAAGAARLVGDGAPDVDVLRRANPGNWHPVEWDELLDGRLGPWVIAIDGGRALSICHTPGPIGPRSAECGVWTDPSHRGRGLAAATAVAWVGRVRAPGRHLFYSTDAANRSSQRVAARLGARLLGWTWRLHRPSPPVALDVHPLCSLRARG